MRVLAALALLVAPGAIAAVVGIGSTIILIMAAGQGMDDERTAGLAIYAYWGFLGLAGASGLPWAGAALLPAHRKRLALIGRGVALLGTVAALVSVVVYFTAI